MDKLKDHALHGLSMLGMWPVRTERCSSSQTKPTSKPAFGREYTARELLFRPLLS
jgi:hypothetical protein